MKRPAVQNNNSKTSDLGKINEGINAQTIYGQVKKYKSLRKKKSLG